MDARCRVELFGQLRVVQGDRAITRFRMQKAGALLAYLAYHPGRLHPRELLIEILWPECETRAGRNRLSVCLSSLRRQLEPPGVEPGLVIQADRSSVGLNPDAAVTDVQEFENARRAAAQASSDAERAALLACAVDLYRGPLLPGWYEEWVAAEQQRWSELYVQTLGQLTALLRRAGQPERALEYARRAVAVEPLREGLHCELMRLYAAAGRPEEAARQFRELERALAKELGVAPSGAARQLARELETSASRAAPVPQSVARTAKPAEPAEAAPETRAQTTEATAAARLPLQLTRFFGREPELEYLSAVLAPGSPTAAAPTERLVTLTGPGGTGKTRLAVEVARRLAGEYAGAVWFVPLADLSEPAQIPDALLDALPVSRAPEGDPLEQAAAALGSHPSLLVLDNMEHLLGRTEPEGASAAQADDAALVVQELLERVPAVTCLVTSRQRLDLPGEREVGVAPLPVPPRFQSPQALTGCAAVQLFLDRAQAVRPDFQVTTGNAEAVAELCERLEGIPLALELAAARAQAITPAQMLAQLDRRYDFLVGRQKRAAERHRTLRAAVDWSFRLLSPELQRLFTWLSVFRGGWTLEAAAALCGSPQLDALIQLREASLITAADAGAGMRFRMLETLREYAADRLTPEDAEEVALRHAAWCVALAEEAEPHLTGTEQAAWLARLELERDNLRAALDWCLSAAPEGGDALRCPSVALRIAGSLWRFWSLRGYIGEGRARLARVLHAVPTDDGSGHGARLARALDGAGALAHDHGDCAAAVGYLERSLPIWRENGDQQGLAASLNHLANALLDGGDPEGAVRAYQEALALYRELGNARGSGMVLGNLGVLAHTAGDDERAAQLLEESLVLKRGIGNPYSLATSLDNLGDVEHSRGNLCQAASLHEEALAIRRRLGHRQGVAMSLNNLGRARLAEGKVEPAAAHLREAVAIFRELDDRRGLAECLPEMAAAAAKQGQCNGGALLYGASAALRETLGTVLTAREAARMEERIGALQAEMGAQEFAAAERLGRSLPLEEVLARALGS